MIDDPAWSCPVNCSSKQLDKSIEVLYSKKEIYFLLSNLSFSFFVGISSLCSSFHLLLDLGVVNNQPLHTRHPARYLVRAGRVQLQMDLVRRVVVLGLQRLGQQQHLVHHRARHLLVVQHVKQHVQLLFGVVQGSLGRRLK